MMHLQKVCLMILLSMLIMSSSASALRMESDASWDFNVYLDGKKIGKHRFDLSVVDGVRQVQSAADFDYKFLFVSVYQYEHRAEEFWADNCLVTFTANTNTNGDQVSVSGAQSDSGFVIERDNNRVELPDCIMTFAYWNPEFLNQPRLLNPQTGEYIDVQVTAVGDETLQVRGQDVTATRFRLTAYETDLTLWYSATQEWLALESLAKGGRIIRYELF